MKKLTNAMMVLLLIVGVAVLTTGCETSDDPNTDNTESYFEDNPTTPGDHGPLPNPPVTLTLSANPTTLAANGDKSVLSVTKGEPPYSWGVQDSSLGSLDSSSGTTVVYTRLGAGDNAITVNDRQGNVGNVVITQP
jgi:hypothetical protein